jgi:hypothetical protein
VTLTVTALDAFDNAILNFPVPNDLDLTTPGATQGTRVAWGGNPAVTDLGNGSATYAAGNPFDGAGQATITVSYEVAFEIVNPRITESVGGQTGASANIVWQPDVLQNFGVVPSTTTPTASNVPNVTLTITAQDQFNNYIPNFPVPNDLNLASPGASDGTRITWGGNPAVTDLGNGNATYAAGNPFDALGQATVTIGYEIAAEAVTPTVTESVGLQTGLSAAIIWQPDVLFLFDVVASPTSRDAGTSSSLSISAFDQYTNLITGYTPANDIDLTIGGGTAGPNIIWGGTDVTDNGDGTATIPTGATTFVGGVALVTIADTIAEGPVTVTVTESVGLQTGNTSLTGTDITWNPGPLARFIVAPASTTPNAGTAVNIVITAADAFGNAKPGWIPTNNLILRANGATQPASGLTWGGVAVIDNADITGTLPAGNAFDGAGQYTVTLSYDIAWESVTPEVEESVNGQIGSGANIIWQANVADQYVFIGTIPDPLPSGDTFFLRIEARDNLGNIDFAYAGGATLGDFGPDGIGFRTDENGATFPDNTINFTAGVWEGNIRTDTSIPNNINRVGNQAIIRVTETTAPLIGGARDSLPFTVAANQLDRFQFTGVSSTIGSGIPPQVRYFTRIPIEIIALDKYGNYVDIGGVFTGLNCTISDVTGTIYEDVPYGTGPGDFLIDFVSTNIGGYAVAYYGTPAPGNFVIQATAINDAITVIDGDGIGASGTSNTFNVVTDIVEVDITQDLAPKVALESEVVDMLEFSVTNVDVIEQVQVTGFVFNLDSSISGASQVVDPSTLIDSIQVETVSTSAVDQVTPTVGVNDMSITLGAPVLLVTGGGSESFRVTVRIRADVSSAVVPNFQVRIGDVIGTFQPSAQPIVPVDTGGNNITDPQYYLRSSITQIRQDEETAAFNYPNPFNPRRQVTNIVYFSQSPGQATVKIFTITGRIVRTLEQNAVAGSNEVVWDGKNGRGQVVRNGVYVAIILPPGGSKQQVKIAVVK